MRGGVQVCPCVANVFCGKATPPAYNKLREESMKLLRERRRIKAEQFGAESPELEHKLVSVSKRWKYMRKQSVGNQRRLMRDELGWAIRSGNHAETHRLSHLLAGRGFGPKQRKSPHKR